MLRLKDKVALVTGGGSGIGRAICERFAEEGACVVVTDINGESASEVAKELMAKDVQALSITQDVTSEEQWKTVIDLITKHFGKLDILVNNAGIALIGSVEDATLEDWQTTQRVNLDSVFLGTREAIKVMKGKGGSIINISSIEGIVGEPLVPAYNASKGGVRIFTKSAALHCADAGYGIRVNSVHPGYIATPMVDGAMNDLSDEAARAFQERIINAIPMGALGEARDVANASLFLASDESRYMTGSELVVDGGYTAR